ncbi:cyanase [Ranunculus cassubicifolius]
MAETKSSIVSQLLSIKTRSGKTFNQLAEETGLTNVYVAQLLRRQAQLKPQTAPILQKSLPELTDEMLQEMMKSPMRSYDPHLIDEPTFVFY